MLDGCGARFKKSPHQFGIAYRNYEAAAGPRDVSCETLFAEFSWPVE